MRPLLLRGRFQVETANNASFKRLSVYIYVPVGSTFLFVNGAETAENIRNIASTKGLVVICCRFIPLSRFEELLSFYLVQCRAPNIFEL